MSDLLLFVVCIVVLGCLDITCLRVFRLIVNRIDPLWITLVCGLHCVCCWVVVFCLALGLLVGLRCDIVYFCCISYVFGYV